MEYEIGLTQRNGRNKTPELVSIPNVKLNEDQTWNQK